MKHCCCFEGHDADNVLATTHLKLYSDQSKLAMMPCHVMTLLQYIALDSISDSVKYLILYFYKEENKK